MEIRPVQFVVALQPYPDNFPLGVSLHPNAPVSVANKRRIAYYRTVDEGRKRVLLIAATILAARKLADWDGRPSPAFESAIVNAISVAERIMARIDARWPVAHSGVNRND